MPAIEQAREHWLVVARERRLGGPLDLTAADVPLVEHMLVRLVMGLWPGCHGAASASCGHKLLLRMLHPSCVSPHALSHAPTAPLCLRAGGGAGAHGGHAAAGPRAALPLRPPLSAQPAPAAHARGVPGVGRGLQHLQGGSWLHVLARMGTVQPCWVTSRERPRGIPRAAPHRPPLLPLRRPAALQDFDSPGLKNKKHWNSFTSAFFLDADWVLGQLRSTGGAGGGRAGIAQL